MVTRGLVTYTLHAAGLINQLMSIENASIISSILDSSVLVHDNRGLDSNWRKIDERRTDLIGNHFPKINDLIVSKNSILFEDKKLKDESICLPEQRVESFFKTAISVDGSKPDEQFLDGRDWIRLDRSLHYRFVETLGWYSIVFWNINNLETSDFEIKFKQEYIDFASKISKELGEFSSIHIRGKDIAKIYESKPLDIDEAVEGLRGENVVIITDEQNLGEIKSGKNITNLNDFIIDNFLDEFLNLPFHDETTFGLICLLVACNSKDFSGTFGSTYSGYIHRQMRIKDGEYEYKFVGHKASRVNGKNPWYLCSDLPIETKVWCREWQ